MTDIEDKTNYYKGRKQSKFTKEYNMYVYDIYIARDKNQDYEIAVPFGGGGMKEAKSLLKNEFEENGRKVPKNIKIYKTKEQWISYHDKKKHKNLKTAKEFKKHGMGDVFPL